MAPSVPALRERLIRALGFLDAPGTLQGGGVGPGALLLLPLLLVLPLLLSGIIRAVLGVGISTGLGLGVAVTVLVAAGGWLGGGLQVEGRRQVLPAVLVLGVAMGAVFSALYTPAFEGFMSVGGGDAGNHVALRRHFIERSPDVYEKFVTFYSFTHGLEALFGLDAFESFRAGYYAIPLALVLCMLAGLLTVSRAWAEGGQASTWIAPGLFLGGFVAAGFAILFRLLHYHQADGFYAHLFGLIPAFLCWVLFGLLPSRALRVGTLLLAVLLHRFTYGLNLGDVAAVSAVLMAIEALGVSHARGLRWALLGLAAGLGGAALFAYAKLSTLIPVTGAIQAPRIHAMLRGEALLSLLLLLLPLAARGMGLPLGAAGARLALYAGSFGAINSFILQLYLWQGFSREYYFFKYPLHGAVLVLGAALVLLSALLAQVLVRWGRRQGRAAHAGLLPLGVVAGIALFNLHDACTPYRSSFRERRSGAAPWSSLLPLADRDGWRHIEATLAREGAEFGGLLSPTWPMMNFMNAGLRRTVDEDPLKFGWEQYAQGLVRQGPGLCVFWYATERDFAEFASSQEDNHGRLADVARALDSRPGKRCEEYRARWDARLPLRLCHLCEPAREG
ncbi:MAG: hypothetical protein JXB05_03785 [Myxococcaceae bacterium]|nr:hypothetical protein [Myxococcaceae bacterium]